VTNKINRQAFFQDMRNVTPSMPIPREAEAQNLRDLNVKQAYPMDCATGRNCEFGPHGPDGMIQCRYCGAEPKFYEMNVDRPPRPVSASPHLAAPIGSFADIMSRPDPGYDLYDATDSEDQFSIRDETAVGTHSVAVEPPENPEPALLRLLVERLGGYGCWVVPAGESRAILGNDMNGFSLGSGRNIRLSEIVEVCRNGH
jgi:hypothetical protein